MGPDAALKDKAVLIIDGGDPDIPASLLSRKEKRQWA